MTNPLSVLIVEDLEDAAESMAMILQMNGYHTRIAKDADGALVQAAIATPDVVLLDIGLPGADGWAVARAMRKQCNGKQPVIVAVTGYATAEDREKSAANGIDLHLAKPVEPAFLVGTLKRFHRALAPYACCGS